LIPYAPPIDEWTDEHYNVYSLVELVLGNREELSDEDKEDIHFAQHVEELIDDGDPNWLDKVEQYMNSGYDLDSMPLDDIHSNIDKEQKARGQ
jgi:hypothetical protein